MVAWKRLLVFGCLLLAVCVTFGDANSTVLPDEPEKIDSNEEDAAEKEQTFEDVEKGMKDAVGSLIRKVLPYLLKSGSDVKVSGQCSSSIMRIIGGVRQLREWAIRFIDASGKIPPGLLEGTSLSLGDYDECLDIQVGKKNNPPLTSDDVMFTGQYCLLESYRPEGINKAIQEYMNGNMDSPIAKTKTFLNLYVRYKHLSNSTFKIGVCIPSKCSKEDLQNILDSASFKISGKINTAYCTVKKETRRTVEQNVLLGLFGTAIVCLIMGTIADVYLCIRYEEKGEKPKPVKPGSLIQMIRSVSLYSNAKYVLSMKECSEPLSVLCALRPITIVLLIYSHTYGHIHELHFQKFSKPANFLRFFESFTFSGIANGSVTMDTIAFLAAVTITYTRWRDVSEKGVVKLNFLSLFLKRFCRMSAAQLLVIGIFLLLPLFGSGPFWPLYIQPLVESCKEKWWLNILYINNFWSAKTACLYHTWVLAVIMQLTLISLVVLLIMKWSSKAGIGFMLLIIFGGVIAVGAMTIVHDLPGSLAFFMLDNRTGPITWKRIYTHVYDHMGPFCIGLLTGYYLALKKDTLKLTYLVCSLLWCCAIACNTAVMFGLYHYRNGDRMGLALSTFYAIAHRNVWTLGIAWLVVACTTGHGGIVTKILNSRIFLLLDRLCFMAFVVHIPLMTFHSGIMRERWYMGHFELMMLAIAYIALSFMISFVLYISFVKPYYFIEVQVASCFRSRKKMNLRTASKLTTMSSVSVISADDTSKDPKACVNLGYCEKTDNI